MTPLVSILIPAYNAQRWIGDTIESALAQTWPRKEIIIVDDGSVDRTPSIARQFASATVKVLWQENQGASAARNKAFELCQGDYIQWLDADDLLARDKIAGQLELAHTCEDKRALLSAPWGWFMYRVSTAQFQPSALWNDLTPVEWLLRKMVQNLHMQTATWLVSRELTEAAGPWDTRLSLDDDGEYFCRVLLASSGVRFVPEAKVFYRASGPSRLSRIDDDSSKKLESQFLSMKLHIRYLLSLEDTERTRTACVTYLQTWAGNFVETRPDIFAELVELAEELGGKLRLRSLGPKYEPIARLLGFTTARRMRACVRKWKWYVRSSWDKLLATMEAAGSGVSPQ